MTRLVRLSASLAVSALSLFAALALVSPADAQQSYIPLKRHEPIWAVSAHGGFYDYTGVIQGTVAERDLPLYGGRFVDGRPVNGEAKLRNLDGRLLYEGEYRNYRAALLDRLNRVAQYESQGALLSDLERENLSIERGDILTELSTLDRSYRERTPFSPTDRFASLIVPASTSPYAPSPIGYAQQPAGLSPGLKDTLLNQGMNFLSRLGF